MNDLNLTSEIQEIQAATVPNVDCAAQSYCLMV
jgi:hypothetical protein